MNASNVTVFGCSKATNVGYLRFADEEFAYQPDDESPLPVNYVLYFTILGVKRFLEHICSIKSETNNNIVSRLISVKYGFAK